MIPKPDAFSSSEIVTFGVLTVVALLLRYVVAFYSPLFNHDEAGKLQEPPMFPHVMPLLGNVPFKVFWNPVGFIYSYSALWKKHPVRLRAFFKNVYIIQGVKDQLAIVKLPFFFVRQNFVLNVFLYPKAAAEAYLRDNSGARSVPYPGSQILQRNRVDFHIHSFHKSLLMGSGQPILLRRLSRNARDRLSSMGVKDDDWTHLSDFMSIFKSHLTAASIDSFAPALLARHPHFAHDLWAIDQGVLRLWLRVPRFFNLTAHRARDRALDALFDWHAWARDNFCSESIDEQGNDPFWGLSFFRERQRVFSNMDGFDGRAMASEDLAFFWGAHSNVVKSTFWLALEAFRDTALLQDARQEVQSCIQTEADGRLCLDTKALVRQPLLQAMFAESHRLRVHGFAMRCPQRDDICLETCKIPRNSLCISSLTSASMDAEFWGKERPVDEFWPGRFLKRDAETNELKFSLPATQGYWLAFGASPRLCPGRVFTKHQNLVTLALLITMYDCEILAPKEHLVMDTRELPLGTVNPRFKIPVRMRRTKTYIASCV
ncbi:hypothetical protein CDD82_2573 [Ophiocordyceps australis]|uniref:Cytochrome P450 n=1 Tax=Ophiocordyceps australis TaxID=1399860 RepID=A0A2C5ZI88_9HYPO|nr:hypothetical protein CDD82_2573 [Ophiocordyceps australis]